ncbi:hypothetical protein VHEMI01859 [[Torrubiella] hemipterigena]|uniref:Uncharacterized protein n=1 Tax=[Torrubiella] hemipterigena TaxID=1531966 RepID=A0A0A1T6I9_9HYPO|nr:hypothetical protein VHEMI01859 [[Torrubiella] hemipterigena]
MSSSSQVEILVHVAAPSKSSDDTYYRQLAQSYLSFKPKNRQHISSTKLPLNHTQDNTASQDGVSQVSPPVEALCRDSQELSFTGAFGNHSSPLVRLIGSQPDTDTHPQSVPVQNHATPPSEIGDSYTSPNKGVVRVSPTKVLRRYISASIISDDSSPPTPSPTRRTRESAPPTLPQSRIESVQAMQSTRMQLLQGCIPGTPLAQQAVSKKRPAPDTDPDTSRIEVTHISSSIDNDSISSTPPLAQPIPISARRPAHVRSESEPMASKRLKYLGSDTPTVIRSSSDSVLPHSGESSPSTSFTLAIRPPSPPVSVQILEPHSLIPPKLEKLASDLSSRYKPVYGSQSIQPFDRGYWLVDCSSWPPHVQDEAWSFLSNYIQGGLAGWGVWCRRGSVSGDWLRIYSWAHVAKHTYLLAYLASGRHIKTRGASWYGADGEVLITVQPVGWEQ